MTQQIDLRGLLKMHINEKGCEINFLLLSSLSQFQELFNIQSMTNLNSFYIGKTFTCHPRFFPISVLIVCSPLNSPTTHRIINQHKHYQQTKILLIDIIGNVFSFENQLHNASEHNDLLVLTVLSQKFKHILSSRYHVEFSRYLNLRGSHSKHPSNESGSDSFCDFEQHNGSHYGKIANNFTSCQREIKERCSNHTNEDIKSICTNLTARGKDGSDRKKHLNDYTFNKQLVFSEHFNLFDFITSLARDEKNASNHEQRQQFDFLVLDFRSILNASNLGWRPLVILEADKSAFVMHRALSESDVFDEWFEPSLWQCGSICWSVIAAIFLILICLIVIISLSAGIAAR